MTINNIPAPGESTCRGRGQAVHRSSWRWPCTAGKCPGHYMCYIIHILNWYFLNRSLGSRGQHSHTHRCRQCWCAILQLLGDDVLRLLTSGVPGAGENAHGTASGAAGDTSQEVAGNTVCSTSVEGGLAYGQQKVWLWSRSSRPYHFQPAWSSCSFLAEFRSEKGLDCIIVLLHHELLTERCAFSLTQWCQSTP